MVLSEGGFSTRRVSVTMASLDTCRRCGASLEPGHQFCWNCGARRPPDRRDKVGDERPASDRPRMPGVVAVVSFLCAGGTVVFLVWVAQMGAFLLHPGGIATLRAEMLQQGWPAPSNLTAFMVISVIAYAVVAALHLAAFVGLQRRAQLGWVMAVLVSALWSLALVGIPFLWLLLRSDTRRAFGMT
jgi:hypothetical protein